MSALDECTTCGLIYKETPALLHGGHLCEKGLLSDSLPHSHLYPSKAAWSDIMKEAGRELMWVTSLPHTTLTPLCRTITLASRCGVMG